MSRHDRFTPRPTRAAQRRLHERMRTLSARPPRSGYRPPDPPTLPAVAVDLESPDATFPRGRVGWSRTGHPAVSTVPAGGCSDVLNEKPTADQIAEVVEPPPPVDEQFLAECAARHAAHVAACRPCSATRGGK